jgi:hypothetical protein
MIFTPSTAQRYDVDRHNAKLRWWRTLAARWGHVLGFVVGGVCLAKFELPVWKAIIIALAAHGALVNTFNLIYLIFRWRIKTDEDAP